MNTDKLKVFHGIVNYGTQAGLLARIQRENFKIKTLSVTKPDKYKREIDVELRHGGNKVKKAFNYLWNKLFLISCFFRFNTFHFYYGKTLLKNQWDLPFYRLFKKKVIMHYLGNDVELYHWSIENYEITNMENLMTKEKGLHHDQKVLKRMKFEAKYIDYKVVCAPQYSPFVKDATFIPLAIDLSEFKFIEPLTFEEELKIIHAPTSRKKKGTQFLIEAVNKLKNEGHNINLKICENLSHQELKEQYKQCHISVVALMGGWYGTAGVEAMATGRPIVTFIRPSLLEYTDFKKEDLPIISAHKNDIYLVLKDILQKKYDLKKLSYESFKFVHKFHNPNHIAEKFINIYQKLD